MDREEFYRKGSLFSEEERKRCGECIIEFVIMYECTLMEEDSFYCGKGLCVCCKVCRFSNTTFHKTNLEKIQESSRPP